MNTDEMGGGALVVGFSLLLLVLFRDPASGWEAATGSLPSVLYFVVLPVLGVVTGVYTYARGPHSTVPLFLLGSYLGVVGLALTLGGLLAASPVGLPLGVGLVLLPLSLAALMASVLRSTAATGLDSFISLD